MYSFSGNRFEIGQQFGELYKSWGVVFPAASELDFLEKQLRVYECYAPEILEEIRGVADGYRAPFRDVASRYILGEVFFIRARNKRCCTIGGFCDRDGKTWVIRNYDWHPVAGEHFKVFRIGLPDISYIGISDMGMIDETSIPKSRQFFTPHDLLNQHGLFVGITFAHCWKEQVGITSNHIRRLVIERCKSVGEALDLFDDIPVCVAKNFFVADASGDMAVIQHAVSSFDVRRPDDRGILAVTNHYVGSLEVEDKICEGLPNQTSWERYDRVLSDMDVLSQKNGVCFDDLRRVMNGEKTPVFQSCSDSYIQTCWTLLMNLPEKEVRLIGNPHAPESAVVKLDLSCEK